MRTAGAAFFFGAKAMKTKMISAYLVIAVLACAGKAPVETATRERNLDGVMQVIGRFSFAHACPCDGLVLTAAHVANPLYLRPGFQNTVFGYSWSDNRGGDGYLISEHLLLTRDLAIMRVQAGSPAYYRHAEEPPEVGETLVWKEFDFGSLQNAFGPIERQGIFLRSVAGHLILDHMPVAGGSGSCVLNSKNEVVATVAFSHRIGAAVIVSVYGRWWPGGSIQ